jgi:hypothetical protein
VIRKTSWVKLLAMDEPNVGGRPSKKTAETIAMIKKALALGFSNADAAKAAKIALSTLDEWMKDPAFKAEIESEIMMRRIDRVERIEKKEPGWQALAWLTERAAIFEGDIRWISPDLQIKCRLFEAMKKPEEVEKREQILRDLETLGYGRK